VAAKRKRSHRTQIGGTAEIPSIESIQAAATAATDLAKLAEEWAESLLNVYLKAPQLPGAQELIDKIARAHRVI
jgi:hypothetical protein